MGQTIRCPECKTEQPKQAICEHCNFDIRAFALSRQKAQSGEITCPDCKGRFAKQSTCPMCGFDIRSYALSLNEKEAPPQTVPCPNCFERTPENRACEYCGFDLRLVDQRTLYKETVESLPDEPLPPEPVPEMAPPISLSELFSRAWGRYRQSWGILTVLYLLTGIFALAGLLAPLIAGVVLVPKFHEHSNLILFSALLLSIALSILTAFWGMSSMTAAVVDQQSDLKDSLKRGGRFVLAYGWMAVLSALVITGGFSLVMVPGILFLVWAFASQFIIFREHERGLDALLKSRHYVRGHWMNTFTKLLVIFGVMVVSSFIPFGQIIFFPFMLSYLYEMYEDLRLMKVDENPPERKLPAKAMWAAAGVLGLVLTVGPVLVIAGPPAKYAYQKISSGEFSLEQLIPPALR